MLYQKPLYTTIYCALKISVYQRLYVFPLQYRAIGIIFLEVPRVYKISFLQGLRVKCT